MALPLALLIAGGVFMAVLHKPLARILYPYHRSFGFRGSLRLAELMYLWFGLAGIALGGVGLLLGRLA